MLDQLTVADFAPWVGEVFHLALDPNQSVELTLVEAAALRPRPPGRLLGGTPNPVPIRPEPFSILFRGPHTPELAQQMYRIEHPQMGAIELLFLVPVGIDTMGRYYEAVFN